MNKTDYKKISVCTSVYKNDNPAFVRTALDSLINQTVQPTEIIIVRDGIVPDQLQSVLDEYSLKYPIIKVIPLKTNKGLGNAMRIAVENAKYELIARMDSDDIASPNRFELQLRFLENHPDVDIVGGQISEFIDTSDNIINYRIVPEDHDAIYKYLKERCPFNHVTVMFKRKSILDIGNYQDWHYNEDYFLWIRMALNNCTFANLPDILVNVRVGQDMYQRRGGWKYFKSEAGLQYYMLKHHLISPFRYCYNVLGRFVVQVLMPNKIRGYIFQKAFRKINIES